MTIKIFPEDIVQRCLWDSYVYYVVGSDKDAEKILKENKEIELSEKDALVIGLLKIINTDNLIHKYNSYVVDLLSNKSINNGGQILIRKKTIDSAIDKFVDKFPDYWIPNVIFKNSLIELVDYVDEFKKNMENFEIIKITDNFGIHDFVNSTSVKKLISFNY